MATDQKTLQKRTPTVQRVGSFREMRGFGFGLYDPGIIMKLAGTPIEAWVAQQTWHRCGQLLPALENVSMPTLQTANSLVVMGEWLLDVVYALQSSLGLRVHSKGVIIERAETTITLLVPSQPSTFQATKQLLSGVIDLLCICAQPNDAVVNIPSDLSNALQALTRLRPKASNVERFFKASCELELPYFELPLGMSQFGHGARACWLNSSMTDATPSLAAFLARNKAASMGFLRDAGLPATRQSMVRTKEAALEAAHKLGFPVVVKPNDLDGGVGVAAGLETDDDVVKAFIAASALSKNILVEKHFFGRDYRLTVFQGELIWAIERVAAGVDGDGLSSISALIEATNADLNRALEGNAPLKPIVIDAEILSVLSKQGKTLDWVPPRGEHVRLRRISNIATGGYPVGVKDLVHPDNAALAVRAAAVMRLDLAGIDLLIPDISVSWYQSSAAICEVNAQPTLGQTTAAHLYALMLKTLVPDKGRLASVLIVGPNKSNDIAQAIATRLTNSGLKVGLQTQEAITIDSEPIGSAGLDACDAGRMIALNRDTDAIILTAQNAKSLLSGLGIQRLDAVILLEGWQRNAASEPEQKPTNMPDAIAELFLKACDGVVFEVVAGDAPVPHVSALTAATWTRWSQASEELPDVVSDHLLARMKARAEGSSVRVAAPQN